MRTTKLALFLFSLLFMLANCTNEEPTPTSLAEADSQATAAATETATALPSHTNTAVPTDTPEPTATSTPSPTPTATATATATVDPEVLQNRWRAPLIISAFTLASCQTLQEAAQQLEAGEIDGMEAFGGLLATAIIAGSVNESLTEWEPGSRQDMLKEVLQEDLEALRTVIVGWYDEEITSAEVLEETEALCPKLETTFGDVAFAANQEGVSAEDMEQLFEEVSAALGEDLGEDAPEPDLPEATPEGAIPEATPESDSSETVRLGELVEQDGYSFVAVTVEDPATPGDLYTPEEENTKVVAVEVIVGNVSGERITVNPLNATLVDTEGFTYQPALAGREGQIALVDLEPGERVKGWIAFEVSESSEPSTIKYSVTNFPDLTLTSGLQTAEGEPVANADVPLTASGAVERDVPAALGETVERDGYSLTAESVEDPTTPGTLYTPEEGKKLLAVQIVVGNESDKVISVNPLNTFLVDTDGYVYTAELGGRDGQINTTDLSPGERVRGWVAFEVPEGATPESVRYRISGTPLVELQTGLSE